MSFATKCKTAFLGISLVLSGEAALAEACDYRPSHLIAGGGTKSVVGSVAVIAGTGGAATATTGTAMTAAGYYTLVHATTGATMLGSTAAGASAAGTVGIIAGTGGGIGAVAAFITAPATIVVAGVAAVGTGGFEVVCYFKDERITDYDEVLERLKLLEKSNPELVRFTYGGVNPKLSEVVLKTSEGEKRYKIKKLYIVNGMLMHRDWGRNTKIGQLAFIVAPPPESGKK